MALLAALRSDWDRLIEPNDCRDLEDEIEEFLAGFRSKRCAADGDSGYEVIKVLR
jgi:hypothetical protein